jgi:carbon-monoxide dehydrogenase medium subunit
MVDLQALGLNRILLSENLQVGATAKLADLVDFLRSNSSGAGLLLRKAIHQAGPNTYRHAATLGGIVASRLPDNELLAALLVLEAQLSLRTPEVMSISLLDYLGAEERPPGLITDITVPWTEGEGASQRVARTPADYPIVSITLWQPATSVPRLAATGIGGRPLRLVEAEKELKDGITEEAIQAAATAARAANRHPGDFRGGAGYRAHMAAVLTRRLLRERTAETP